LQVVVAVEQTERHISTVVASAFRMRVHPDDKPGAAVAARVQVPMETMLYQLEVVAVVQVDKASHRPSLE
jgi:hypothetical protein